MLRIVIVFWTSQMHEVPEGRYPRTCRHSGTRTSSSHLTSVISRIVREVPNSRDKRSAKEVTEVAEGEMGLCRKNMYGDLGHHSQEVVRGGPKGRS